MFVKNLNAAFLPEQESGNQTDNHRAYSQTLSYSSTQAVKSEMYN